MSDGQLNPTSVAGLGEDTSNTAFLFTGINDLSLLLGHASGMRFTVNGTFTDAAGNGRDQHGHRRQQHGHCGAIKHPTGPYRRRRWFHRIFDSTLIECDPPSRSGDVTGTTNARLTGFGPIGDVTFGGFAEAQLLEGSGSDTLSLNTSVATLAVKVYGNGGDDTFNVEHVGQSMYLEGDSGQDVVNVIIPDAPGNHSDLLNLSFLAEQVNVDNTGQPGWSQLGIGRRRHAGLCD